MSTSDNPPYTIEELITELTRLAAARGWGLQSFTNIREIEAPSGQREISLLAGNEKNVEEMQDKIDSYEREEKILEEDLEELREERDALKRAVDKLSHEVLILREDARDTHA